VSNRANWQERAEARRQEDREHLEAKYVDAPSWRVRVHARGRGLLLGGVRVHESSRFATRGMAARWAEVVRLANEDAGCEVGYVEVSPSSLPPELLEEMAT
jgi:hypothetical protein